MMMMQNDPPPAATCVFSEVKDEKIEEKKNKAALFFEKNKVTKVPTLALQSDLYKVEKQNWVCFSIIRPDEYGTLTHGERSYSGYLVKFRGCFETKEQAVKHIEKLLQVDRHFDIHLVPAFQWASLDDSDVQDREYVDERIKEIVTGYFKKENERIAGFRDRIADTETSERSEEATKFFEKHATSGEVMNMDEVVRHYDITPSGLMQEHAENNNVVVSEILLD